MAYLSGDPTECKWCGAELNDRTEKDEAFWAECYGCDATVAETCFDRYEWAPTVRTVVELARQVIQDDSWPHISPEIRAEICNGLADDIRLARLAAAKKREAVDANRPHFGAPAGIAPQLKTDD